MKVGVLEELILSELINSAGGLPTRLIIAGQSMRTLG